MGFVYVEAKISNPFLNGKRVIQKFLVDSDGLYSLFPKELVCELKIEPRRNQTFTLANGKKETFAVGLATIKIRNRESDVEVILGKGKERALLGAMTLESLGLEIDPIHRRVKETDLFLCALDTIMDADRP